MPSQHPSNTGQSDIQPIPKRQIPQLPVFCHMHITFNRRPFPIYTTVLFISPIPDFFFQIIPFLKYLSVLTSVTYFIQTPDSSPETRAYDKTQHVEQRRFRTYASAQYESRHDDQPVQTLIVIEPWMSMKICQNLYRGLKVHLFTGSIVLL